MASTKKIENKRGISYKITVSQGRDSEGKQILHYKTWTPPAKMRPSAADKKAEEIAREFEESLTDGYIADDRQTFQEYAEYVLELKETAGVKHSTIVSYRSLLDRINPEIGYMKLREIKPQHLNRLYKKLSETVKGGKVKAVPKDISVIPDLLKKKELSHEKAADLCEISPATVDNICLGKKVDEESARKLCKGFGLEPKEVFEFEKNTETLSPKTVLEHHRLIRTILSQAEKEMIVPFNAASKASPPKQVKHEPNYFQPHEISDILDALDKDAVKMKTLKWKTIVHLLIVTGCRRGEIAALKWKNVDEDNCKIKIDSTLLYSPDIGIFENSTKTGDTRYLKLPAESMKLLMTYKAEYGEKKDKTGDRWHKEYDYCFVQDDGKPIDPDSITAYCNRLSKNYPGLPHINPHAFRHTQASTLINSGQDIVTVSKRLGHARTSTTLDIYSHLVAAADANASECIADVLLRRKPDEENMTKEE